MSQVRLGLTQSFRGQDVLSEVASDQEHGLYSPGDRPQRRIGYRPVSTAAERVSEPVRIAEVFSPEASFQIRLDLLEHLQTQEISRVHPDYPLGWYFPIMLVGRVDSLKSVVSSEDVYAIR